MTTAIADLRLSEGQYYIVDRGARSPMYSCGDNGLVGAGEHTACICPGTLAGFIRLAVQAAQAPPAVDADDWDEDDWDEIVEVSLTSVSGTLAVVDDSVGRSGYALPNLAVDGPGSYRIRVHARGRDAANRVTTVVPQDEIIEEHLLAAWPAAPQPGRVLKATDQFGTRLRTPTPTLAEHSDHLDSAGNPLVCVRDGHYRLIDLGKDPDHGVAVRSGMDTGSVRVSLRPCTQQPHHDDQDA